MAVLREMDVTAILLASCEPARWYELFMGLQMQKVTRPAVSGIAGKM